MGDRREIDDEERRARLVARHGLGRCARSVRDAVRGVAAQHSSDPVTPYLSLWARVEGFRIGDLDDALYGERALVRMHAMRRTLFVVPTEDTPVFAAGASRDVAARERRQLERWLASERDSSDLRDWLADVEAAVLRTLADGVERRTADLAELVPDLTTPMTVGSGRWTTRVPLSSRLLFLMAMDGRIVRTRPAGTWRSSQYHWTTTRAWLGEDLRAVDPPVARAEVARRYLETHGPVTEADLRWWAGWTAAAARRALADVGAVAVDLAEGEGFVLADDLDPVTADRPSVSLLPGLDPTPMGWKERAWYLGGHAGAVYDRNGNAGPTVWVDGRIVGGWGQLPDGEVVHRLLEDVGEEAARAVAAEAAELTAWLEGTVVTPRFRTPLERELSTVEA